MKVYGIDFTSSPSRGRPITCIRCELDGSLLLVEQLYEWEDWFVSIERFLERRGPWIAGIDFPFGQSRKFVANMDWPQCWSDYVYQEVEPLRRDEFRKVLDDYRSSRQEGDKEHRRATDIVFRGFSPQKVGYPPVGLMFFEGSQRLRKSGVMIPGLQESGDPERVVVEAFPAVAMRALVGPGSKRQVKTRKKVLSQLSSDRVVEIFGIGVDIPDVLQDPLANNPTCDRIDALLCAVQSAWAWRNHDNKSGWPFPLDSTEGWIAHPPVG